MERRAYKHALQTHWKQIITNADEGINFPLNIPTNPVLLENYEMLIYTSY